MLKSDLSRTGVISMGQTFLADGGWAQYVFVSEQSAKDRQYNFSCQ